MPGDAPLRAVTVDSRSFDPFLRFFRLFAATLRP
jgi:hypothetical protein